MKERMKFVLEWERRWNETEGRGNVAELCREFGVSRDTCHRWIRRFQNASHNVRAVEEKSRRPHKTPTKVEEQVEDFVVAARKADPTWGPKKLRGYEPVRCLTGGPRTCLTVVFRNPRRRVRVARY